jgi:hypothetical protein
VTVTAAAAADPNVKGAAVVTVGGGNSAVPTVTISSINQTNAAGQSVPANLVAGVAGQLDVILNVDTNGGTLKSVTATVKCGTDSLVNTQTISSDAAPLAADAAAAPVTLSFNTAQFNAAGVPALHNGQCSIVAVATTSVGTQGATNATPFLLANVDAVLMTSTFAGGATANDANGLPWKSGSLTVAVTPIVYSGRTVSTVTISIPNSGGKTVTVTTPAAGVFSASFPNATSGGSSSARIGQIQIDGGPSANGFPQVVTPAVVAIDAAGNDLNLAVANPGAASFRLDNKSPNAPTVAQIAPRQQGWVNGTYVFTGAGVSNATTTKYVSGSDDGVSDVTPVSNTTGTNGQTTFQYFVKPAAQYSVGTDGLTNGTAAGAANCPTTGFTQVTTGGDLAATANNQAYVVRILELDKLNNIRCTDVGTGIGGAFTIQTFGVDKVAPTAALIDPSADATAAGANQAVNIANPTVVSFKVGLSDDASGFSSLPLTSSLTRLAIDPATNAPSTSTTAFGCPIGLSNNACTGTSTAASLLVDGTPTAATSVDGYYTLTATPMDLARNAAPTLTRSVVVDRAAPTVGGIAVPATIVGGQSASFATSATDNLDLVSSDYSLLFGNTPASATTPRFSIRTPGPAVGTAFDNVLTTAASFNVTVANFIRNLQTTDAGGVPQANAATGLPDTVAVRVYDAAGNSGTSGLVVINAANVPQTTVTSYAAPQSNTATFTSFLVSNAAANISNCPAAGCTGGVAAANATSVQLQAQAVGTEGTNFQFNNPFAQVQFYYLEPVSGEYVFIGAAVAPVVTDNSTTTARTFTYTLANAFDPPASLLTGAVLKIVAVGVNTTGDALAAPVFGGITLTNP